MAASPISISYILYDFDEKCELLVENFYPFNDLFRTSLLWNGQEKSSINFARVDVFH